MASPTYRTLIEARCFNVEKSSDIIAGTTQSPASVPVAEQAAPLSAPPHALLSAPPAKAEDVKAVEKTTAFYNLSKVSNHNPFFALSTDKRIVVINPAPNKVFADIQLECHMYLFKWDDIPDAQNELYEKEEIANFLEQCKVQERSLVETIRSLNLPI